MFNFQSIYRALFHEKDKSGDNWYYTSAFNEWDESSILEHSLRHPILTPALLFVSTVFSNAKFHIRDKVNKKDVFNHPLLTVLNNPNYFMGRTDLLMTVMFLKKVEGVAVIYLKRGIGQNIPDSIYVLRHSLIKYPEIDSKYVFNSKSEDILNKRVIYDKDGENLSILLKDLIFIYDLPNIGGKDKNPFHANSVLKGLEQTLRNTNDSFKAKNIILKTNGKELIKSSGDGGAPLSPDEKIKIENKLNNSYGLGFNRSRGIVTRANIDWKSMHIALRDLGLDESVKVDGNVIYTALHIPKDILSLEAKKTTYNNFKESMISYIQNVHLKEINDLCEGFTTSLLNDGLELVGTYNHMPIMFEHNQEKYKSIQNKATALEKLLNLGVPEDLALEMCDFDKNIKLIKNEQNNTSPQQI